MLSQPEVSHVLACGGVPKGAHSRATMPVTRTRKLGRPTFSAISCPNGPPSPWPHPWEPHRTPARETPLAVTTSFIGTKNDNKQPTPQTWAVKPHSRVRPSYSKLKSNPHCYPHHIPPTAKHSSYKQTQTSYSRAQNTQQDEKARTPQGVRRTQSEE